MLRRASILLDEPLDLFEARDKAFLAGRASALLLRLRKFREFLGQFVEIRVIHSDLPSCNA